MPKFRYVGIEDVQSPGELYHYGVRFERGEVSEITDEALAKKLEGQEGFEKVGDDEETLADRRLKEEKEANLKARKEQREAEKKAQDAAAEAQKFKPVVEPGLGIEDREKDQKDRIHAKSGMTSGNIVGKDDAKPGMRSDNQPESAPKPPNPDNRNA